jgi:hypothetical protein
MASLLRSPYAAMQLLASKSALNLANTHASEFVDGVKEQGNLVWPQLTGRPAKLG